MSNNEHKENHNNDHKKFSVTIIGIVIYSIVLIGVMVGSYIGVKAILRSYDSRVAEAAAQPEEAPEQKKESKPTPTPEPEEEEEPEDVDLDHEVDANDLTDPETGVVDYSKVVFKPGKRIKSLKWKDTVFSRIENVREPAEAPVNTFGFKRVSVKLPDNNSSEYKVYTNPDNDLVEKITEVKDCGGNLQVLDYYFDNGDLNYVAEYRTYIDKPVNISSANIESRYYFRNDCMVRYIYCKDGNATEYTVADIDSYSKGTVDQYDYLEKDIINRAYIVYNIAPTLKETEVLYGYVMDEFSMPMEDAKITVKIESNDKVVAETITDGDGFYKLVVDCTDDDTYSVTASKDTLTDVGVYGITARYGSGKYSVEPIYLGYTNNLTEYPAQFMIRDAIDPNKPLSGAGIMIRRGLNNRTGEVMQTGALDDNGNGTVKLTSGSYTAEISKGGYETLFLSVIIRLDHQFAVGFAMPDVADDTYQVVVSWESAPLDLNCKAISSNQARVISSPVDSLGLTTAETVTIDNSGTDDYRFYVTDLGAITSGDVMAYNMTGSCAYVNVYDSNGLQGIFHVPAASAGVVWEAFEIHNKSILPINSYYYAVEDDALWKTR